MIQKLFRELRKNTEKNSNKGEVREISDFPPVLKSEGNKKHEEVNNKDEPVHVLKEKAQYTPIKFKKLYNCISFDKETKAKIENEINQKKADVKRLAIKEAKLKALEAADDYHLEETKEGKQKVRSEYEREVDEKIKNLLNERRNAEKQQKVSKTPKTEQDKIKINAACPAAFTSARD
jgi:hypothetical protein